MTLKQMSLSMERDAGFERHRKAPRRNMFLAEMDQVVRWAELCAAIEPHYRKVRYKGLAKNSVQVTTLFALVNLWMARKTLMQAT